MDELGTKTENELFIKGLIDLLASQSWFWRAEKFNGYLMLHSWSPFHMNTLLDLSLLHSRKSVLNSLSCGGVCLSIN